MTPGLVAGSFLIMLSMVGGVPIPMNGDNRGEMNEVSPEKLFTLVQTGGMNRRGDRRDTKLEFGQFYGVGRGCRGRLGGDVHHWPPPWDAAASPDESCVT